MNIGKTAALVTAAAGAVVFGGADAGALGLDRPAGHLDFTQVFGDPHGVVQQNRCDSTGPANAGNVVITAPVAAGSHCANIAVSAQPFEATHRNTYGHAIHADGPR